MFLWSVNGEKEDTIIQIGYSSWAATNLLQMFESTERWWNCGWKVVCGKDFWFGVWFSCFYRRGLFGFEDEGEFNRKRVKFKKAGTKDLDGFECGPWRNTKAWDPEKSWRGYFSSWRKCVPCILKLTGRKKERSHVGWLVGWLEARSDGIPVWWLLSIIEGKYHLINWWFLCDLRAKKEGREEGSQILIGVALATYF